MQVSAIVCKCERGSLRGSLELQARLLAPRVLLRRCHQRVLNDSKAEGRARLALHAEAQALLDR